MIKNLDHQSKKTRESLKYSILTEDKIKELLKDTISEIIWSYNPVTDLYTKLTATLEKNKIILKNPKNEIVNIKDEKVIFATKKLVLDYQRAPERRTTTKKNLLRDALGPKELDSLVGKTVWGFNEANQEYQKYSVMDEKGEIVLRNEDNKVERFIDAIFKTESEIKRYQKALFM